MKLTPHFTLDEMIHSQTATRHDIDNHPSADHLVNLVYTCQGLEAIRALFGHHPIQVSSGYRSPKLNRRIGGSSRSAHMSGLAADFTIPGYTVDQVVKGIARSKIVYHQVIDEFGRWIHLSIHPFNQGHERIDLLARRKNGKTIYSRVIA